jgi:hypothetical protein
MCGNITMKPLVQLIHSNEKEKLKNNVLRESKA